MAAAQRVSRARPDAQVEIVIAVVVILALARLLPDRPAVWIVGLLLCAAVIAAGRAVISAPIAPPGPPAPPAGGIVAGGKKAAPGAAATRVVATVEPPAIDRAARVVAGIEAGIVPGVLAAAISLSIRLVPLGYWMLPALALAALALDRALSAERQWATDGPSGDTRFTILVMALGTAFLGFAGVAMLVNGGLGSFGLDSAGPDAAASSASDEVALLILAGADGLIAGLIGYRLVRLGPTSPRDALISALTYAAAIAIGAGLLRAIAVPRLLGPALLTLLVYLWDAFRATTPSIRRDPRWLWQVGLLVAVAAVVIAWNLALRA